jgi:hypothetical protein
MHASDWIALVSVGIAVAALRVSLSAKREAKNAAILAPRREAIEHVRKAAGDIVLADHIDSGTTLSLAKAIALSKMVFTKKVSASLENLHGIAFRLQGKSFSQRTEQEAKDRDVLVHQIQKTVETMLSEAEVN